MRARFDLRDNPSSSGAVRAAQLLPGQRSHAVLHAFLCLLRQGPGWGSQRGDERCRITALGPGMLRGPSRRAEGLQARAGGGESLNLQPPLATPRHSRKPASLGGHPSPL